MIDWLDEYGGLLFIATLLLFIVGAFVLMSREESKAWESFMADCQRHRPTYECTALWRSGESQTVVVPMPVPVSR